MASSAGGASTRPPPFSSRCARAAPLCAGPCLASRASADPFLTALVHLLLPERHRLLERVDGVLARRERVVAVRRGDRDRDARLADAERADAMVDRDRAELVALLQVARDLRHHVLGHLGVGLVLEGRDITAA